MHPFPSTTNYVAFVCVAPKNPNKIQADVPEQNSLEKLLVSLRVPWPVLLDFLIHKILQCEGIFFPIQIGNLRTEKHCNKLIH